MLLIHVKAYDLAINLVIRLAAFDFVCSRLICLYLNLLEGAVVEEHTDTKIGFVFTIMPEDTQHLLLSLHQRPLSEPSLVIITEHDTGDKLLAFCVVLGEFIAVDYEHEVLVEHKVLIRLMHISVFHVNQISYHTLIFIIFDLNCVIKSSAILPIEGKEHWMVLF